MVNCKPRFADQIQHDFFACWLWTFVRAYDNVHIGSHTVGSNALPTQFLGHTIQERCCIGKSTSNRNKLLDIWYMHYIHTYIYIYTASHVYINVCQCTTQILVSFLHVRPYRDLRGKWSWWSRWIRTCTYLDQLIFTSKCWCFQGWSLICLRLHSEEGTLTLNKESCQD